MIVDNESSHVNRLPICKISSLSVCTAHYKFFDGAELTSLLNFHNSQMQWCVPCGIMLVYIGTPSQKIFDYNMCWWNASPVKRGRSFPINCVKRDTSLLEVCNWKYRIALGSYVKHVDILVVSCIDASTCLNKHFNNTGVAMVRSKMESSEPCWIWFKHIYLMFNFVTHCLLSR